MEQRSLQVFICILFLSFVGSSCTDSATDSDSGPAIIEGRVESVSPDENEAAQTRQVEGAVVTASQVASDGSLETIGGAEAETDAQGEFALEISADELVDVEAASRIIIVAQSDEGTGKAFVTSNVQSGNTVQAKPVTEESAAEAEVLQQVVANGEDGMVANADIEAAVDSEVAAGIEGNPDAARDLAIVLGDQSEIRAEFYDREGIEVDEGQLEDIDQIKTDAQVELENRLYDLEDSEEERENAFNDFLETMANAELEAGVEASAAAKASELASRLVLNGDLDLSEEAVAEIYRSNSFQTAVVLDIAVRNQLETLEAEENTLNIAENAGNTLQSEIRAGSGTSAEEINSLFADYRDEVVTGIESDAAIDGNTFTTVNSIVGGESGAKAAFEAAVEGISDPGIIVDAYVEYDSNVRSTVNSGFDEEEGGNLDAYAELLILLNIAS